ncbi:MAG: trypsin-like peptidase domain-containing protein [Thiothrix litoralis]|uniref:trypsin-like peptidase domain-containing protein n=1 Tax=Thiothrix litoralis TaxID=2891210 RepID=UPI003C7134E5
MNPYPIVKITVFRTDQDKHGKQRERTGTGYVIADGLILTAHHVVEFAERDKSQPIQLEWTKLSKENSPCKAQMTDVIWAKHDVAVLACVMPDLLKAHLLDLPKLAVSKVASCKRWESAGYPKINQSQLKDATGEFGVDLSDPTFNLTLADTYGRDQVPKELVDTGWGGMSGAPVFSLESGQLQAVITVHNLWMEKQLQAVSIPYLLADTALGFRQAVGLDDNAVAIQQFFDGQKQQILELLCDMRQGKLFQALAAKLPIPQPNITPDSVYEKLFALFDKDCLALFDWLLQTSSSVLKQDISKDTLENVRTLFCLFASLMASTSLVARQSYIKLSVYSKMASELHLAPLYETNPDFTTAEDGELKGRYSIDASVFTREIGWEQDDFKNEATKIIFKGVNGKDAPNVVNAIELWKLNEKIKQRQNRNLNQLHRFELNRSDDALTGNPLSNLSYCQALNAGDCLPNLPIIHYGEVDMDATLKLELALSAKMEDLFTILQQHGYSA